MRKTVFYFVILFFSLTISLPPDFASADTAQPAAPAGESGFSINPFYQSIDIQKDQASAPFSVEVKNTTNNPAVFRVSVLDFGTLNESGGVAFLGASENLKYGLASWVSLPNDTLVLKPGETQTVNGTIENKESLSPGGHYGAVFFKIEGDSQAPANSNDQVAFNPSFASLLFVKKSGGEVYGLNLDSQDFSKSIFSLPSAIKWRMQNTGNVHIIPRGAADIYDPLGRLVEKGIINADSGIILPESFRVFPGKFMELSPVFWPGRYKMKTSYRYDGLDIFADSSLTFWLIPPLFILALVLLVAALFLLGKFVILKKLKKK